MYAGVLPMGVVSNSSFLFLRWSRMGQLKKGSLGEIPFFLFLLLKLGLGVGGEVDRSG